MSNISDQNFTFLQGISSFWQNFFEDKDVAAGLLQGGEQLMGQLYLDLLELVLTPVLETCPIYHREYWHLLTIKKADLRFEDGKYVYTIPGELYDFRYITNKILDPTLVLENNFNFNLQDRATFRDIVFEDDIFDTEKFPEMVIRPGDADGDEVAAFWVVDGRFEKFYLYENFGFLVRRFSRSSQVYKDFVRGIWNYYTTGPNLTNVEAALNLIAGFPLANETGEVVLSIETVDDEVVVTTDRSEYRWPDRVGVKVAVGDTLTAFQPLTNAFIVSDTISDPDWFDGTVIPEILMPGAPFDTRISFKNRNNAGIIGELDLFIGDDWLIGEPSQLPSTGYKIMRNFLSTHIFLISYKGAAVPFQISIEEMRTIVLVGKPKHTFAFVEAETDLSDEIDNAGDAVVMQMVGSLRNDDQETIDEGIVGLVENDELAFHEDYGYATESAQLAVGLNNDVLVIGGSHPSTGSPWLVGDNGLYDPTHSVYGGYWVPFVGGFAGGSIVGGAGLPLDYEVELETFGSELPYHPFEVDGHILVDENTIEDPVLVSPGGSHYRLVAEIGGALATEFLASASQTHSPVLASFVGDLYELTVSDDGVLETITPPVSGEDPLYWVLVEDDFIIQWRVGVSGDGTLVTRPY